MDECLTIIAHSENDELVADAMFYAGGKINYGDVVRRVLGRMSAPVLFYSRYQTVSVMVTAKGFLVRSSPVNEPK